MRRAIMRPRAGHETGVAGEDAADGVAEILVRSLLRHLPPLSVLLKGGRRPVVEPSTLARWRAGVRVVEGRHPPRDLHPE